MSADRPAVIDRLYSFVCFLPPRTHCTAIRKLDATSLSFVHVFADSRFWGKVMFRIFKRDHRVAYRVRKKTAGGCPDGWASYASRKRTIISRSAPAGHDAADRFQASRRRAKSPA
jgi:hypothetical protein